MDTSRLTVAAAMIAGLAIVALVATAWRPRARAAIDTAHTRHPERLGVPKPVTELRAPLEGHTPWLKRAWSAIAGFGLAVWVGAALATVVGFGLAWLVLTLTSMLRR